MKRIVEIAGLVAPLVMGGLFALAGVAAPFGDAGDRTGSSFLIAATLLAVSAAVGAHLLIRTKSSGMVGILCGIAAGVIATSAFADARLVGTAGYWQVMGAIIFSVAACGWHFRSALTESP